jgi:molybdenum cofactor cytidylyltransferase
MGNAENSDELRRSGDGVCGIVLAAGASTRMGRPKPLLVREGETLLSRAVRILKDGGCSEVRVVVSDHDTALQQAARILAQVLVAPYSAAAQPIDSLRVALRDIPHSIAAVVVLPVDCAMVRAETVRSLTEEFRKDRRAALVPSWKGRPGHPVLVPRVWFQDIRDANLPEGLRTLLRDRSDAVRFLEVEDEGVVVDIDTPEEARQYGVDA